MILAFASAAHGRNLLGQWVIVPIAAIAYGLIGWAVGGEWLGAACFALVHAYWLTFRRGKQENIENAYMDTESSHVRPRLRDVLKAHYCVGWLTCLSLYLFNYDTAWGQKLGWEQKAVNDGGKWQGKTVRLIENQTRVHPDEFPFWDCRRPTEFATGLTGDILLLLILIAS